jgi:uncharacterized tellurite resistance protein B-like protein
MEPLVEISPGTQAPSGFWAQLKRVFAPQAKSVPKFYGPNSTLKFDRGRVEAPLVYLVKGSVAGSPDASLIETDLPVSRKPGSEVHDLPYWPSYRGASPQQRSKYIDWLVGGRKDPVIPIGYVFIYFYGLERRVILDHADHPAVIAETIRLLQCYSHSHSFLRYATRLLWTAMWLGLQAGTVSASELKSAIQATKDWSDETRGLSLACFAHLNFRLSANMAYLLTSHDPQAPQSVVVSREPALHKTAFCQRFDTRFPGGLALQVSKRERRLQYFPASATLPRLEGDRSALAGMKIRDVLGVPSQFRPLIEFWTESIEELRHYDRLHRKVGKTNITAEMFEALPEELRQGDHPHFDAWYQVLNRSVTEEGWTVVPAGELAKLEGVSARKKLTKNQSTRIAMTARYMGLAVEPDPRITGRSYAWDEFVSVFPLGEASGDQFAAYQAASVLLELGVAIAAADGVIEEPELRRITSHLESQFALSQQDSLRLAHLRYLRTKHPTHKFDAARSLRKNLTVEQRCVVGQFLVGIAAADNRIAPQEVRALRRAYRELGLAAGELDSLLGSTSSTASMAPGPDLAVPAFRLDMTRVNSIIAETAKVKEFLNEALADGAEPEDAADPADTGLPVPSTTRPGTEVNVIDPSITADKVIDPPITAVKAIGPPATVESPAETPVDTIADTRFHGLPGRYVPFAARAVREDKWQRSALDTIARGHGLMLGGALDVINEWAYESLGDALLVDGDDQIVVQRNLVQSGANS